MLFTYILISCLIAHIYCNVQEQCRTLTLPWGNYSAVYDSTSKLCFYENVRFAQAPIGSLRFQAPKTPDDAGTTPQGKVSCMQVDASQPCTPKKQFKDSDSCTHLSIQQEDCLFLDIYVPASAFQAQQQLPVVVCFYGGAYVYGSKDDFDLKQMPIFDGTGAIDAANDDLIFVIGNYRLGAFGWMAGTYMEAHGTPNAGLHDQRKILEFVNTHISKLNGDNSQVSAWGESAGGSSILHHLIANFQPDRNPLFSRAIIQSPAFEWQWDRSGTLDETYSNVSTLAGCPATDMDCLQNLSVDKLSYANQMYFQETTACSGLFPIGPSLDGTILKELPAVAFPQGNYSSGLESLIVSHVQDESGAFIPAPITKAPCDASKFDDFLAEFIPQTALASLRQNISNQYPSKDYQSSNCSEGDQVKRASDVIRDSMFTCNTRLLYDAYQVKSGIPTYMMQYSLGHLFGQAKHGMDLLPTFWNSHVNFTNSLPACVGVSPSVAGVIASLMDGFAPAYQSYLASHAVTGDPNTNATGLAKFHNWQTASVNEDGQLTGVVDADYAFIGITDTTNTAASCDFWKDIAAALQSFSDGNKEDSRLMVQGASVRGPIEL